MTRFDLEPPATHAADEADGLDLISLMAPAVRHWKALVAAAIMSGLMAVGASFLVPPKFTSINTFLPPRQEQSNSSGALESLSALSGLGLGTAAKGSPDEYIALMQSVSVSDRIIKRFGLQQLWKDDYIEETRLHLQKVVTISAGKKDGLMHVQVVDTDPDRAARIANQYVEELRALNNTLSISEAQQRRVFFERLLEQTRDKLSAAQSALEASGYSTGALNAEPRSAAESYARTKAELASAEVGLQVAQGSLANGAPEVQTRLRQVEALRSQLAKLEAQGQRGDKGGDYVNRYREFKYQETLFDLFARQYETARVDESREGTIQVVDPAMPAQKKSSPKRSLFGVFGALFGLIAASAYFIRRDRQPVIPGR